MKRQLIILLYLISLFAYAQPLKIRYEDVQGKELGRHTFYSVLHTKDYVVGQNEEGTVYRLVPGRERQVHINDYDLLIDKLNKQLNLSLDASRPLFILYYPGLDEMNSNASAKSDPGFRKEIDQFEKQLLKKINGQNLMLFKKESPTVYGNHPIIPWKKDPDDEIKKRFFPDFHYQHSSFVLLFPDGDCYVYLGEFSYQQVFDYIKVRNKSKNH